MFKLEKAQSLLKNLNVRTEKHGQDLMLAADLKYECAVANTALDELDPELKSVLFRSDPSQPDLPMGEEHAKLSAIRFPKLESLHWQADYTGCNLTIYDITEAETAVAEFADIKVGSFAFTPKEGGGVTLSFKVQLSCIEPGDVALLATFLQKETSIQIDPPTVEQLKQRELVLQAEQQAAAAM